MKLSLSLVTLAALLLASVSAQAGDKPKTNGAIPPPRADVEKAKPAPMPAVPAPSTPVVASASLLPPPPLDAAPAHMDPRSGAWRQQWILTPADGLGQVAGGVGDSCGNCRRNSCWLGRHYGRNAWAWCCK